MKIKTIINRILWLFAALILSLFCVFQSVFVKTANAEEIAVTYSDVMTDLQKDENFNPDDYPAVSDDYSLQVIQIAESSDGELFVYVYQPSNDTKDLVATEIRMSTPVVGLDSAYDDYKLTLLSSQGVFDKYKVDSFTVKTDSVRYYDIVQVVRIWDSAIDADIGINNTISTIPYPVGELWTVYTTDNGVEYLREQSEIIEVTAKVVGFIRYHDGYDLFSDSCDSHFVAFSTDRSIDNLIEASVDYTSTFTKHEYSAAGFGTIDMGDGTTIIQTSRYTYGESIFDTAELSADVHINFDSNGIFSRSYTWKQIEKTSDFLNNESEDLNLTSGNDSLLKESQWILRFYDSSYYLEGQTSLQSWTKEYTKVSDVTILRLKFVTDGKSYNLGIVDNKQTGSDIPFGSTSSNTYDLLAEVLNWIMGIGLLILLVVALFYFCPWVISLVGKGIGFVLKWVVTCLSWLVKIIWKLLCFPFKLIEKLFKRE